MTSHVNMDNCADFFINTVKIRNYVIQFILYMMEDIVHER